jgi:hypothetical protein
MNEANYASLEASKRLVDAGIVLETEAHWWKKRDKTGYYLSRKALYHRTSDAPAPSMAEVWRELPEHITVKGRKFSKTLQESFGDCYAYYENQLNGETARTITRINPADALIDLLIWVKKEAV